MMTVHSSKFRVNGFRDGHWVLTHVGSNDEVLTCSLKYVSGDIVLFMKADGSIEPSYASLRKSKENKKIQCSLVRAMSGFQS